MDRLIRFSGILGSVLCAFGVLGALVVGSFEEPLLLLHIVMGVLFILLWFALEGVKRLNEAGGVIKGRTTRYGSATLLYTAVFLGVLISLNWLANRYNKRWDVTEAGVFSLADQSKRILGGLQQPLRLVGFKVQEDPDKLSDLLRLYKEQNPGKVTTDLIDPRTKPQLVDKYEMKPGNVIYLEYGEGEAKQVSRVNEVEEEAVTNAVLKLTRGAAKKIYYVFGHDEPALDGMDEKGAKLLSGAISDEHLTIEPIFLAQVKDVPSDAQALILAAPKKPLLPEERQSIVRYIEQGGRAILLHEPRQTHDIREIAKHFGIVVGDNVIMDQVQRLFAGPALGVQPIVDTYASAHPVTRGMTQAQKTIFMMASTVSKAEDGDKAATYTELLKSSATAWGETNLSALLDSDEPSAVLEEGDVQGPVDLAIAYEKKLEDGKKEAKEGEEKFERVSRLVVVGDSDWLLNSAINALSNRDLALNLVNWVVGEEGGISIRPRSIKSSIAPMAQSTYLTLLASSFLIPELLLILGLMVWWNRRQVSVY